MFGGFANEFKIFLNEETGEFILEKEDSTITLYGNIVNWYDCIAHGQAQFDDEFIHELFDYHVYDRIKNVWPNEEAYERFKAYVFTTLKPDRIYSFSICKVQFVDDEKEELVAKSSIPLPSLNKVHNVVSFYYLHVERDYNMPVGNELKISKELEAFYVSLRKLLFEAVEFVRTFIENKVLAFKKEN